MMEDQPYVLNAALVLTLFAIAAVATALVFIMSVFGGESQASAHPAPVAVISEESSQKCSSECPFLCMLEGQEVSESESRSTMKPQPDPR